MAGVVLIHGAWHGAWCWDPVVDRLSGLAGPVVAVELPLTGYADDVAAARAAVLAAAEAGPVVLVGHSYGGSVITAAGTGAEVAHLVYVAAFAPDEGETMHDAATGFPATPLADALVADDHGRVSVDPGAAVEAFYLDCERDDAMAAVARLRPMAASTFGTPTPAAAWRDHPCTYLLCEHDNAIHPDLQAHFAARTDSTVVRLAASHSPFLSQPGKVAAVLTGLAGPAG